MPTQPKPTVKKSAKPVNLRSPTYVPPVAKLFQEFLTTLLKRLPLPTTELIKYWLRTKNLQKRLVAALCYRPAFVLWTDDLVYQDAFHRIEVEGSVSWTRDTKEADFAIVRGFGPDSLRQIEELAAAGVMVIVVLDEDEVSILEGKKNIYLCKTGPVSVVGIEFFLRHQLFVHRNRFYCGPPGLQFKQPKGKSGRV